MRRWACTVHRSGGSAVGGGRGRQCRVYCRSPAVVWGQCRGRGWRWVRVGGDRCPARRCVATGVVVGCCAGWVQAAG
eukprot:11608047-Prorocentrum_lima.AAC.1